MKKFFIALAGILLLSTWHYQQKANASSAKNEKVTICHRTGNGSSHAITVSINAVPAHMAHGDAIGDCGGSSSE